MKIAMRPLMLAAALVLLMSCFAANAETDLDLDDVTGRFLLPFKKFEKVNRSGPGDTSGSTACSIADECKCNSNPTAGACSVKQLTEFCTKCVTNLQIDNRFKGKVVFKYLNEAIESIVVRDNTLATEVSFPKLVKAFRVLAGARGEDCPASLRSLDFPKLESVLEWFLVGETDGCTGLKTVNAPKLAAFGQIGNINDCNTDIGDQASPLTGCALHIRNNPNLKYAKLNANAILREGDDTFQVDVRFGNNGKADLIVV